MGDYKLAFYVYNNAQNPQTNRLGFRCTEEAQEGKVGVSAAVPASL